MAIETSETVMTRDEAAKYMKMSTRQLDRLEGLQRIRLSKRVVRFRKQDLNALLEQRVEAARKGCDEG